MDVELRLVSHLAAAALFGLLTVWQVVRAPRSAGQRTLVAAFALTGLWAWFEALYPGALLTDLAETARNLVWIGLLHGLAVQADGREQKGGLSLVYGAVAAVLGLTIMTSITLAFAPGIPDNETSFPLIVDVRQLLGMLAAAGGLILVHNFYGQAAPGSRSTIRYAMLGLSGLWFYDLNLYTIAYWSDTAGEATADARGIAAALAAPLFAIGSRSEDGWRFRLSRAATFQSLSVLSICAYFTVMAVLANAVRPAAGGWMDGIALILLAFLTVAAMALLSNRRARAWIRVKIAKHFFEHRYDYRTEWLRFTETLGGFDTERSSLATRIVRAFTEMVEAPGGVLLVRDEEDRLRVSAQQGWQGGRIDPPHRIDEEAEAAFWTRIEEQGHILDLDGKGEDGLPEWLAAVPSAWVGVPLFNDRRLVGLVVLGAPHPHRALDWEDFDLLRTAGQQAANALAEKLVQDALAKAQRFEEFNRRFAFIMHDIKNLVSQLSLLSRNAERHADNPEFRADMVATLKGSVEKMNDLLARLAPGSATRGNRAEPVSVGEITSFAIAARRGAHDIRMLGNPDRWAIGEAQGLEQAIGHLVQNAIDASPAQAPVTVRVEGDAREVRVHIIDQGGGMDAEFLRARLFEPFASTKEGGFGIGAFEARGLVLAMGGRLDVDSQPGKGTRFTITLAAAEPLPVRKSA
ncbi:XrtA/PEP-CTERM system histidine kinase PrsK [Sphingomicrobium sp. XHP0239]|uniref:XrtA/PEP-CTERM system histidine kinase PrsK n=1 Tax=Sphingomicrobium maritimum TaxID=3133972 RepID=UPI0031CCA338